MARLSGNCREGNHPFQPLQPYDGARPHPFCSDTGNPEYNCECWCHDDNFIRNPELMAIRISLGLRITKGGENT